MEWLPYEAYRTEFGGHGQLRGGKGRETLITGKLEAGKLSFEKCGKPEDFGKLEAWVPLLIDI